MFAYQGVRNVRFLKYLGSFIFFVTSILRFILSPYHRRTKHYDYGRFIQNLSYGIKPLTNSQGDYSARLLEAFLYSHEKTKSS